jgi:hypothetical protein
MNMLIYKMVNLIYINIKLILIWILFLSIMKMLWPNNNNRLKFWRKGIDQLWKIIWHVHHMWSRSSMFYIISLGGDTLPYSSFLVTSGLADFWHPYQHNKYVIVQYSTMDKQNFYKVSLRGISTLNLYSFNLYFMKWLC